VTQRPPRVKTGKIKPRGKKATKNSPRLARLALDASRAGLEIAVDAANVHRSPGKRAEVDAYSAAKCARSGKRGLGERGGRDFSNLYSTEGGKREKNARSPQGTQK